MQDFSDNSFKSDKFESFKGINKITRQLPKVKNKGVPAHFFITGKIDKTSFVEYLSKICDKYGLTLVYVDNKGIKSLDGFLTSLIEVLLKTDKKHIDLNIIKHNFPEFLINISKELNTPAFIFIEDINDLSENSDFASWYKRSFDTLDVINKRIPIVFCLVASFEKFNSLMEINPSFTRIFERIIFD